MFNGVFHWYRVKLTWLSYCCIEMHHNVTSFSCRSVGTQCHMMSLFGHNIMWRRCPVRTSCDATVQWQRRVTSLSCFKVMWRRYPVSKSRDVAILFQSHVTSLSGCSFDNVIRCFLWSQLFFCCSVETQRNGLILVYDMSQSKYVNFDYDLSIKILNMLKVRAAVSGSWYQMWRLASTESDMVDFVTALDQGPPLYQQGFGEWSFAFMSLMEDNTNLLKQ